MILYLMTAIKSTGAPRGSVSLAFGVHLKTTVQALAEHMGIVGICPLSLLSGTLTLFQSGGGGADYVQPLALPHLKIFMITPDFASYKSRTTNT